LLFFDYASSGKLQETFIFDYFNKNKNLDLRSVCRKNAVDCILALGGDLYLEDAGPELAGHEQLLGLAVISYPVEDIY